MNKKTTDVSKVMVAIDAAEYLGLPYPTMLKMIKQGVIPAVKLGARHYVSFDSLARVFDLDRPTDFEDAEEEEVEEAEV